jgi:oxygen-independent coproporphyrinogen-3 oxidase
VPFGRSKCRYCGFYSTTRTQLIQPWLDALGQEARGRQRDWPPFDTCYVGGGSPSLLPDWASSQVLEVVQRNFDLTAKAELTLEVNPADVTLERARRWRALGFARVSLGVQSFCSAELSWLGRRHDAEQAVSALHALRAAGFDNLSIDLVQGLPDQLQQQRLASLEHALG